MVSFGPDTSPNREIEVNVSSGPDLVTVDGGGRGTGLGLEPNPAATRKKTINRHHVYSLPFS